MKRFYRWAIVLGYVVVAGGVAGFAARLCREGQLSALLASELDPSDPNYTKVMCGPASLSVALGRLGVSIAPSEIASECRVTSSGVALTDLERIAGSLKTIRAAARKLHWEDLKTIDGVAVLFVNANHYIAVDPREAQFETTKTTAMRVYDREVPARWYSRQELENIWSGESLVITKQQAPSKVSSEACITWDECYLDKGVLLNEKIAHFDFSLRNKGNKELIIEDVKTSCGCIKHTLSAKQLAPGESGQIEIDVNIDGREGYIQQYVVVKTNDSASPVSILNMACGVPRKRPVSSQAIRLKDLPQGGNVQHEFVVADPGFSGIKIRDAKFLLRGNSDSASNPSCSISREMVREDANKISQRMGFPTSPGDYLLRLSFNADNACSVGPFEGDVIVTVESDGSVATHKVDIQGMIAQDVYSVPQMALVTLSPDPEDVGNATIQLRSRANRTIKVRKAWLDNAPSLKIQPEQSAQAATNSYVVTARIPDLAVGTAPFQATGMFELDNGSVFSIPITVFRPPQGVEKLSEKSPVNASKSKGAEAPFR